MGCLSVGSQTFQLKAEMEILTFYIDGEGYEKISEVLRDMASKNKIDYLEMEDRHHDTAKEWRNITGNNAFKDFKAKSIFTGNIM